ncbi:MAG: hypothetical protein ACRDPE_00330 [Solirubrobacterales bacterium]
MDSTDRGVSLRGYPNLSEAARILGVSTATLSRRKDLKREHRGERDHVLRPGEVMRLAAVYRKRDLNDVAQDLIDLAGEAGDDVRRAVEEELEVFFEDRALRPEGIEAFLETARRILPQDVYDTVEASVSAEGSELPPLIAGLVHEPEGD